jgi:hypothetical protein
MTTEKKLQNITDFAVADLQEEIMDYEETGQGIEGVFQAAQRFKVIAQGVEALTNASRKE